MLLWNRSYYTWPHSTFAKYGLLEPETNCYKTGYLRNSHSPNANALNYVQ